MDPKLFMSLFILFASCVYVGISEDGGGGGGGGASAVCVKKVLPCQPYLSGKLAPPATCCVPLKDMVTKDPKCACEIFNNAQLLKSFNITQEDALKLPKACGANPDISLCKSGGGGAAAPAPGTSNSSASSNSTESPKSAANRISLLGGSTFITFLVVLATSVS